MYNKIEHYKNNKTEITEELLLEIRGLTDGKQIALDILELDAGEALSAIHCIEFNKCKEDILYFRDNYLKIKTDNGNIFSNNIDNKNEIQDKALLAISKNTSVQITSNKQTRKSTAAEIFALHQFNFKLHKTIAVVAHKPSWAKYSIAKITDMYCTIPVWMRVKSKNLKTSMTSETGSKILTAALSENSFRGFKIDTLIIENSSNVAPANLRKFLDSIIPITSINHNIIVLEKNKETPKYFIEINEFSEILAQTNKPILNRSVKQIIKDFIYSLYIRIKG